MRHHLGAAEAVLDALAQDKAKGVGKEMVAQHVEEAHGLVFHGVNEAAAVDEFGRAVAQDIEKFGQILGRGGEVAVLDDENVARGVGKTAMDSVPLAFARLATKF